MNEWQPIETAPRDGSSILVYCETQGIVTGAYDDDPAFEDYPWWEVTGFVDLCPSHWMPLPKPPEG